MSSPLSAAITALASADPAARTAAALEIYAAGRNSADAATQLWRNHAEFQALLGETPVVTVGLAVEPATFTKIRDSNGSPRLAQVPPGFGIEALVTQDRTSAVSVYLNDPSLPQCVSLS